MENNDLRSIQQTLKSIQKQLDQHERRLDVVMYGAEAAREKETVGESATSERKQNRDMEQEIGIRWLGWAGFFAVLIGIGLFLKYAIDQGWINEAVRVVLGYVGGAVVLIIGEWLRKKYEAYGNLIQGIAIGILYLTTFAAFQFYGFFGQMFAFVLFVALTALIAGWGIYKKRPLFLIASFLGAFSSPVLVHVSGVDPRILLFPYLALINVAFYGACRIIPGIKEQEIPLFSAIATVAVAAYWGVNFYKPELLLFLALWLAVLTAIMAGGRFIFARLRPWDDLSSWDAVPALFGFTAVVVMLLLLDGSTYTDAQAALISLVFALILFTAAFAAWFSAGRRTLFEHISVAFAVLVVIISVSLMVPDASPWSTIIFGLLAILIFIVGIFSGYPALRGLTAFPLLIGVAYLYNVPYPEGDGFSFLQTTAFGVRLFIVVCIAVIAWLYRSQFRKINDSEHGIASVWAIAAHGSALWLFSSEIAYYYNAKINDQSTTSIENTKNVMISVFWGLYATCALVIGFWRKSRFVRLGSLLLLAATIVKVFIYDFWDFGTLYRMIVSLVLGVLLLIGAYLYHRFEDRVKKFLK